MVLYVLIGLLVTGFGVALYVLARRSSSTSSDSLKELNRTVSETLKITLQEQSELRRHMNDRLREVSQSLDRQHKTLGDRLDNAAKSYTVVTNKLTQLEESNKKIFEVGKDIASLQEILRAPKLRGNLGELFLENLLDQILPGREYYELQYAFRSGEKVDAVVKLMDDKMVCIDSKFPLENFQKMLTAQTEHDDKRETQARKAFFSDVKKHVDAIAAKYILPDQGTLDFALMYIPAENVYYETITKDLADEGNVCDYALKHRVIPVSPNTFYVYLQTVMLGLKGMQVEKGARQILNTLSQLKGDFGKFAESYELVGSHLGHAQASYDKSEKRLHTLNDKMSHLEGGEGAGELLPSGSPAASSTSEE